MAQDITDRRKKWSFLQAEDYGWKWAVTNPDGTDETSPSFATMKECADNARLHGYVPWQSDDERRRALRQKVAQGLTHADAPGSPQPGTKGNP
jgi:hypothetical protein